MPPFLRTHAADNVGIVVHPDGLRHASGELIPQGQKIALESLAQGQPVIRYGQVIGYAAKETREGAWLRTEEIETPEPPELNHLPLATSIPKPQPALAGFSFDGYRNADGSVGTRNILGVATTVQCCAPTVDYAVQRIKTDLLPRYSGVDDVVAVTHNYGCGVAIDAPDAAIPIRTLQAISQHPNLGGRALMVSLGCEKLQPVRLLGAKAADIEVIRLQDHGGFADSVATIVRAAERKLEKLNERRREALPASCLSVGLQCGGSDAFSGVTCNPAVGHAADLLVRAGATVFFSEVTEVRDAIHLLTPRAASVDVAAKLIAQMKWYDEYLARGSADRRANPTPGNKRGGLANIVEKALGSIAKAGSSAIADVAGHGEKVTSKGLVFAATPASDFICGTQQLGSMNLHVFTTGEGSPYGLSMVPVIKISSRTSLAERWHDLIDLDAGTVATGKATVEEVGFELFRLMLDVASGRCKTWSEKWGLGNSLLPFNPGPVT